MAKTEALTEIETETGAGSDTGTDAGIGAGTDTGTVTGAAPCCPPLTERPLTTEESERTAAMFKALGDPVRVRLFSLVASYQGGEACVCDISDVGVSQPTVSHHLRKLREAGLLTSERRGTWVDYRVEPSVLAAMGRLLGCATD
jgi:ArsR family transcriptional regulator, arsenate/arsenite/antimonite-responsive transcriptional repressor